MKIYDLLVGACLVVGTICAGAQTTTTGKITTAGSCSPVVIQPKDGFQIICHDTTLTHAEALKQARQISELLSKLRSSSQNNGEVSKKLDHILSDLDSIKAETSRTNAKIALERAPVYTLSVINGVATPDLSKGLTQRVVLSVNGIIIATPKLPKLEKDEVITWTLFVDEDAVGEHNYTTAFLNQAWPGLVGNTRISFELVTEANGHTVMRGVPIGNTIEPAEATTGSSKEHD